MSTAMAAPLVNGRGGPVQQSVRIAFLTLRVALLLLAAAWAVGNIRPVPADLEDVFFARIAGLQ